MDAAVKAAGRAWRWRLWLASTVALAVTGAGPALAQEQGATALQTITVEGGEDNPKGPDTGIVARRSLSASKTDTSLRETPQAISVVTRDQMDAQGVNTVAEALRYTPGILPDPNGYDIRYDWLYIRGFNTYGTMWLDGRVLPGDSSNYAAPSVNAFALERVDVIKGPASVLYGRAVPGGLVNQVGKRPQDTAMNEVGLQTGEQHVRGFEVEGKYELTPEISLLAAYAYSDSEIVKSNRAVELGREMLRLPEHQGSVWISYRPDLVEGLTLNAGVCAMSSYQTDSTYRADLRIPGRTLVDIGAEYDFAAIDPDFAGTRLRLNVTNLFDKEYVSHCLNITGGSCNYGAGRAITASLKYSW